VQEALNSQILSIYSYIFAAIIAIAKHSLTRLHAVFVLQMAGSPLSFYLVATILKSMVGKQKGNPGTWRRRLLNRVSILAAVPLWAAVLIFVALPPRVWQFQQAGCEYLLDHHVVAEIMLIPLGLFLVNAVAAAINVAILVFMILIWAVGIYLQRDAARKLMKEEGWGRIMATWYTCSLFNYQNVSNANAAIFIGRYSFVDAYPFIQFMTVVVYPSLYWIITLEVAAIVTNEEFQPSYGQVR
jgi:hypothetical protein